MDEKLLPKIQQPVLWKQMGMGKPFHQILLGKLTLSISCVVLIISQNDIMVSVRLIKCNLNWSSLNFGSPQLYQLQFPPCCLAITDLGRREL